MSFVIPVKRLRETDTLMAFYHPKPSYRFHVFLVIAAVDDQSIGGEMIIIYKILHGGI